MSIQSPKSQRPKAPGERPAQDNLPEKKSGGMVERQGQGPSSPSVPGNIKHHGGAHQGSESKVDQTVPVGSPTPHQGGGPGFAKNKGDAERKGGTVHQT